MNLPVSLAFIFLSNPVSHGLNVSRLKTQPKDSFARARYFALKIPIIQNTINDATQIIITEITNFQFSNF